MRIADITGERFGRLVALKRIESKGHVSTWICKCDCGKKCAVRLSNLKTGNTKSCGCLKDEQLLKVGSAYERLYKSWCRMKQRCYDTNTKDYKRYGGRGIIVCDEWVHDYEKFRSWAYANGYDESLPGSKCSLDRIDVNGNYEPSNCRWVDMVTQLNNTRSNHFITFNGETMTICQWARKLGLKSSTIHSRLRRGYTIEQVLDPVKRRGHARNKNTA